jgi:hypothetical protein
MGDNFESIIPFVMDKPTPNLLPPPPNLFASLRQGFDMVAAHPELLLFPIGLDLLIWLGPHLHLRTRMLELFGLLNSAADLQGGWPSPEVAAMVKDLQTLFVERLNLVALLRTYPVGVPSVMSGSLPVQTPLGSYINLDIVSFLEIAGWWLLITLAGLTLGILYYRVIAHVTLFKQVRWLEAFQDWPHLALKTAAFWLVWCIIALLVSLPFTALVAFAGPTGGIFASLCMLSALATVLYPFFFTAHAMALYGDGLFAAARRSFQVSRVAMPVLLSFIFVVFVLSQILDSLWSAPDASTWLALLGIGGHAFVSAAFLAASFRLFHDAVAWVQQLASARFAA